MAETISQKIIRPFARGVIGSVYPQEVIESVPGTIQLVRDHYNGGFPVLSLFSHMSQADGPHVLRFLSAELPQQRSKTVMPIAQHTYTTLKPVLSIADIAYGVDWNPVVTRRTIEEKKGESTLFGLRGYLERATEAMKSGGMVAAALQAGGDLPRFGEPTTVFSTLVRTAKRLNPLPNIGVQFIGIVPKRSLTENHGAHGSQTLKKMRINLGRFSTLPDVLAEVGDEPVQLDLWAHKQMKSILPDWYTES